MADMQTQINAVSSCRKVDCMVTQRWVFQAADGRQSHVAEHCVLWHEAVSRSGLHAQTRTLITCINHACMQHMGHVGALAAETVRARGSYASCQITYISRLILAHAFIESVLFPLGQMHKPGEI